jgi:hypothetical protein
MNCVYDDDVPLVTDKWLILSQGTPVTFEMRWKKFRIVNGHINVEVEPTWVLAACVPVTDENGALLRISGCTTDITGQKKSAQVAVERANALERARASEHRFVRFAELAPVAIYILSATQEVMNPIFLFLLACDTKMRIVVLILPAYILQRQMVRNDENPPLQL